MPCLDNGRRFFLDYPPNLVEFWKVDSPIPRQHDRLEPELGLGTRPPHVYVHGFAAVKAVEEEPIRARNARYSRHEDVCPNQSSQVARSMTRAALRPRRVRPRVT